MTHPLKIYHLLTLLLLISLASVTGLLFIPALPKLDNYFDISNAEAQWILGFFLIGYCLGQLPYGPLANRFGRKKTIYMGIALSIFGSFLSYFSPTFPILCAARFIQALGAAVGLKMSFTIVNDVLSGKEASKVVSHLSLAFGIMPGLAVAAGGLIVASFGWRDCFLFLALYSLVVGLLSLSLPETGKSLDLEALQSRKIIRGYAFQFANKNLLLNAILTSLSTSMIYLFATIAPYLAIEQLKMPVSEFGFWNIIPAIGLVLGSALSSHCSMKYSFCKKISLGMSIIFCGVAFMTITFFSGYFSKWSLFLGQFIIQSGYNLVWANTNTAATSQSEDKSNATSVVQFINVGGTVLSVFLIGLFSPTNIALLPLTFSFIVILMLITHLLIIKNQKKEMELK